MEDQMFVAARFIDIPKSFAHQFSTMR
jgi:hypothetical protein